MRIIGAILCLAIVSFSSQDNRGLKGILPLHSTRADVERVLGPPTEPCSDGCMYDTKNEGVFVRYSVARCPEGDATGWNVPPNTVTSLSVNLAERPKLTALGLNLKRFKKTRDPELNGYSTYENEDKGVSYAVSADGRVYRIHWYANAKDDKVLRCRSVASAPLVGNVPEPIFDPHTSVGLTFNEDKPRLDQFAANLKKVPEAKGYIIAYGGDLGVVGEARTRLNCVRNYLQARHHIKPSRLVMMDGGYASRMNVELLLIRPSDPKPKPAPTRNLTAVLNIKPRADPCK